MRAPLFALVTSLAACGGTQTTPPETLSSHASEPIAPRDTPAPRVLWRDNAFGTEGLPAVARQSEITVVPVHESDGGRGYPNIRFEVRDRNDKTIQTIAVMTSNEYEKLAPDGVPTTALQQKLASANAELAKLHAIHDLLVMKELALQKPPDGSDEHLAIGDNLDVDWEKDHLHVFPHNTDHALATADGHRWLAPAHSPTSPQPDCENPAFLAAVYHAPSINVVVAQIRYHGTDTCWEPGDQLHVIAWY